MLTDNIRKGLLSEVAGAKFVPDTCAPGLTVTRSQSTFSLGTIKEMMNRASTAKKADLTKRSSSKTSGVIFANGLTAPKETDITISGDEVPGNFSEAHTQKVTRTENGVEISTNFTITNNDDSEFTISEIALVAKASLITEQQSSQYYDYFYMLDRTLLDSPVTIPAGGVGQITYTITIEYPA